MTTFLLNCKLYDIYTPFLLIIITHILTIVVERMLEDICKYNQSKKLIGTKIRK